MKANAIACVRRLRILIPITLVLLGSSLLIGCFNIDRPEKIVKGTDYRPVTGEKGQYLVDGQTRRQDLEAKLGPPQFLAAQQRVIGVSVRRTPSLTRSAW